MRALVLAALLPVAAQANCLPTPMLSALLATRFGEAQHETETIRGVEVETWANPETGTWTLTATADGTTCVLSSGQGRLPPVTYFFPAA